MSQRQQYGSGSVYQRKDGRWVAVIGVAGKRVSRYARSEKEAKRILLDLQVKNQQGTLRPPSKVTVGEWIEDWLQIKAPALRPSTERTYRSALSKISNDIGHLRVDKLTPLFLTQTFSRLIEERHGVRRLHLSHTCLKACLEQAVDLGLIAANPMARVPKPHWEQQPRDYWTIAEASRFIDTCLSIGWRRAPLLAFLTVTGVRISEALGLQWSDVDWEAPSVRVRRALVWRGGEFDIVAPKTKAGTRTVSLPEPAVCALSLVKESSNPCDSSDAIFRTATGRPPRHEQTRDALNRLCREAGVPRINVHGLRHVAAMLALEAVGDIYLVQQRLGHSHVGVTLQIYGYPARREAAVAPALDDLLDGARTNDDSV